VQLFALIKEDDNNKRNEVHKANKKKKRTPCLDLKFGTIALVEVHYPCNNPH
jgi:hypothetical protein